MEHYSIMMSAMILNSFILTGFLLLMVADLLWVKGVGIASAVRVTGYSIIGCAFGLFALAPNPSWPLPMPTGFTEKMSGWRPGPSLGVILMVAAAISGFLLFWSVFLEIRITKKKLRLGPSDIVRTGTYALCRHPGFWWLAFLALAIGGLKGFTVYFFPIFMMISFDLLLILLQDRYTFPKVFQGYDDYKKSVPFLIPRKRTGQFPIN